MERFQSYLKNNKAGIMALAMQNTHLSTDGLATISRNSEWAKESVWDSDYKELIKAENGRHDKIATS